MHIMIALVLNLLGTNAYAGGSISAQEFVSSIPDRGVQEFVTQNFELNDEGRATRMGRHMPNPGARVAPFEILGAAKSDHQLFVLHVENDLLSILTCKQSAHYAPDCE